MNQEENQERILNLTTHLRLKQRLELKASPWKTTPPRASPLLRDHLYGTDLKSNGENSRSW